MSNPDIGRARKRAPVPSDECGLVHAAAILGDRWTLLILREAFYGVSRFDDLQADLGAPRQALADRLGRLVKEGLLARRAYRDQGQRERHEYVLTDAARALAPAFLQLMQWGEERVGLEPGLKLVHAGTGLPIAFAPVDSEGRAVGAGDVRVIIARTGEPL